MRLYSAVAALLLAASPVALFARPITPEDQVKEMNAAEPDIAPDGSAVVYTLSSYDTDADTGVSHIWLAQWDGSGTRQLTNRKGESESTPRYSPDGKTVGFLSSRTDDKGESKLWLLPMNGGEAVQAKGIAGSVDDFVWSPDGKYLALIVSDSPPEPQKTADGEEIPPPIVVDRFRFKEDGKGYLGKERARLFLYDIAKGSTTRLTDGDFDEMFPAWSPDSTKVAFVSRRAPDPDRTSDYNIYVASIAQPGAAPLQITAYPGADSAPDFGSYPVWSPDGKQIAYVRGGDPKLIWYAASALAVVPSTGGAEKVLTAQLDRNVYNPAWSADGKALRFILEDDGKRLLASVPATGGTVSRLVEGEFVLASPSMGCSGRTALLHSTPQVPWEVAALEGGKVRPLSRHNADWLKDIDFGAYSFQTYTSKDGTEVHGFMLLPPPSVLDGKPAVKLRTMLHPHGGPAAQYEYGFDMWQQVFAGAGYAVLTPNPRGSTGRGTAYASAINAAWGSVDVEDDLAAVDHAVALGVADPDRLVVGGWSYGGMSTNYLVASDQRFKAAMAGASIANVLLGYGTDHYPLEYEMELGLPWKNPDVWIRNSYPFLHADQIKTPTMFMVGAGDVNVPTWASEQQYQALRSLGVDTQLVIYPNQSHGFGRPSYVVDRMKRWLAWYEKYVK